MTNEPSIAEAIQQAHADWLEDEQVHPLYVYVVNALGLDPDAPASSATT